MKVTIFMAMSVNGMIAEADGSEKFLSHANWEAFSKSVGEFGNFIIGSNTYTAVQSWGEDYSFDDFPGATRVVVSDDSMFEVGKGYRVASSPQKALDILKEAGFENALLTGGSTLNASFVSEDLLDEIVLNIEPALVGKGIPLFAERDFSLRLSEPSVQQLDDDIIQLHYVVAK